MPRIAIQSGSIAGSPSVGVADTSAIYERGIQNLAKGMESVAGAVTTIANKQNDIRDKRDAANASVDIAQTMEDLERKYENDGDFRTWDTRYKDDTTKAYNSFMQKYGDNPRLADMISAKWKLAEVGYYSKLKKTMFNREAEYSLDQAKPLVNQLTMAMSAANTEAERQEIYEKNKQTLLDAIEPFVKKEKLEEIVTTMHQNALFMNLENRIKAGDKTLTAEDVKKQAEILEINEQRHLRNLMETEGKDARVNDFVNQIYDKTGGDFSKSEKLIRELVPSADQHTVRSRIQAMETQKKQEQDLADSVYIGSVYKQIAAAKSQGRFAEAQSLIDKIPARLGHVAYNLQSSLDSTMAGSEKHSPENVLAMAYENFNGPVTREVTISTHSGESKVQVTYPKLKDPNEILMRFPELSDTHKNTFMDRLSKAEAKDIKSFDVLPSDNNLILNLIKQYKPKAKPGEIAATQAEAELYIQQTGDHNPAKLREIVANNIVKFAEQKDWWPDSEVVGRRNAKPGARVYPVKQRDSLNTLREVINRAIAASGQGTTFDSGDRGIAEFYTQYEDALGGPAGIERAMVELQKIQNNEKELFYSPRLWPELLKRINRD